MSERTWEGFLAFLYELPARLRPGRQRIRVVRDNLQTLVEKKVRSRLTQQDERRLFPLGFNPAESDLKAAAGVGLEHGLITAEEYEKALLADKAAGPFGFLQTVSGKTFGESVAPEIARFWLAEEEDEFIKISTSGLYDIAWTPQETGRTIRIELKASSEESPRFQQIRHSWMTDSTAPEPEYDALLCLGVSNAGLEWWAFGATDVADFIREGIFTPQHGGSKMTSGAYWIAMNAAERARLSRFNTDSTMIRSFVKSLAGFA